MRILREATAQTVTVGPFVDNVDGYTAETGLTIATTDVRISKDGAAFADASVGGTHREDGYYSLAFGAGDTDTVGELFIQITMSGALHVLETFTVIDANTYDGLTGANVMAVDVTEWEGAAVPDLAQAVTDAAAILVDTAVIGAAGAGLTALATAAALATVDTVVDSIQLDTTAILADTNELQTDDTPAAIASIATVTASAVADAVLNRALSGHTTAGTLGKAIADTEVDAATAAAGGTNNYEV